MDSVANKGPPESPLQLSLSEKNNFDLHLKPRQCQLQPSLQINPSIR